MSISASTTACRQEARRGALDLREWGVAAGTAHHQGQARANLYRNRPLGRLLRRKPARL